MSKTLNPTLRIGGLVAPESLYGQAEAALQATAIMVSPLSCAIMEQWLIDGTAEAVSQAIQDESKRRTALARSVLGEMVRTPGHQGYHSWLPMPAIEAQRLEHAARALDVLITSPSSTAANPAAADGGVRLCLGAASMTDLNVALGVISKLLLEVQPSGLRLAL